MRPPQTTARRPAAARAAAPTRAAARLPAPAPAPPAAARAPRVTAPATARVSSAAARARRATAPARSATAQVRPWLKCHQADGVGKSCAAAGSEMGQMPPPPLQNPPLINPISWLTKQTMGVLGFPTATFASTPNQRLFNRMRVQLFSFIQKARHLPGASAAGWYGGLPTQSVY